MNSELLKVTTKFVSKYNKEKSETLTSEIITVLSTLKMI